MEEKEQLRSKSRKCRIQTQKQMKNRQAIETVRGYKFRIIERRSLVNLMVSDVFEYFFQRIYSANPWAQFNMPHCTRQRKFYA